MINIAAEAAFLWPSEYVWDTSRVRGIEVVFAAEFEGVPSRLPSNTVTFKEFADGFEGTPSRLPSNLIKVISFFECAKTSENIFPTQQKMQL